MTSLPEITISGRTIPLMDHNYEMLLQEQPSLLVAYYNFESNQKLARTRLLVDLKLR